MSEKAATRQRARRWLLSYRISLIVFIPLIVVITGAVISVNAYVSGSRTIARLTENLFDEIAQQTAQQATAHVAQARPAVDMLSSILAAGERLPPPEEISDRLVAVARANSGFAWVSFSDERGSFIGIHRTAAGLVLNKSRIESGKTVLDEWTIADDGVLTSIRHEDDTGYDPRTRPFYKLAARRGARVWTPPYVFYEAGVPGITCASPVQDASGALRGVVTVDFDLNALSRFVGTLRLSDNAQVFVFTEDEVLLAHTSLRVVETTGRRDEGELVTAKGVGSPLLDGFFSHRPRQPDAEGTIFRFAGGGEAQMASVAQVRVDDDIRWSVGVLAPESDFTAALERNNRIALGVSALAVLIAVAVAAWMASRVARPLALIAAEMERAGQFDLATRPVPPSPFREIESMSRALDGMKGGLRSFASYVPRDVVKMALASGEEARLGGRLKTLTIFFSDLAGFTTMAEKMTPNELVLLLAVYFDEMTAVIAERRCTVDKFIGDGIMAFWGAPTDEDEHAALACEAALGALARLEQLKRENDALAGLHVRIGLSTGEVVVGNIGSPERLNYTVMGDDVNLAARLEGLSKVYGTHILVSEATFVAAKSRILMRPIDIVAVKGKAKGVRVYEPLGVAQGASDVQRAVVVASERALAAYLARDFPLARQGWTEVLELLPDDEAARHMRERALELEASPPPVAWTGVFVATEK